MTLTTGDASPPPDANAKRWRKERCKGMKTPTEKLRIHAEIERENARKLNEWKQKRKGAAA